jgi:hypothetical protein
MCIEAINIALGAIPVFWFSQMDGRGICVAVEPDSGDLISEKEGIDQLCL